jgi:hypothetical protein
MAGMEGVDLKRSLREPHGGRYDCPMPFVPEALRFAENPATSDEQLRLACEILTLDSSGTTADIRARLLTHLNTLDSAAPIVCLNPNIPPAGR